MRHPLLGLFLILSLGLLGYYTLFMTDVKLFGESLAMVVQTSDARGVREGDSVQLAGMRIGRVKSLSFDPAAPKDRRVTIDLILEQQVEIYTDHTIQIADATVLGGHVIQIEPGTPSTGTIELDPARPLIASLKPNAFDALAKFGDSFSGSSIGDAFDDLSGILSDLREGGAAANLSTTLENLAQASDDVRKIAGDLEAGRGTLGALLTDASFFDTWRSVGTNLDQTITNVREGEGILPALISDASLRERVTGAVTRADEAFGAVSDLTRGPADGGKSVAQLLFNDSVTGEQLSRIVANIDKVTTSLGEGEGGTLSRLLSDTELYDLARDILTDLSTTASLLASGEGTLGKLIQDDSVYTSLDLALRTLTRSLEDYREAAPVSVFSQVLFGSL